MEYWVAFQAVSIIYSFSYVYLWSGNNRHAHQITDSIPFDSSQSLHLLKCEQPKKPTRRRGVRGEHSSE